MKPGKRLSGAWTLAILRRLVTHVRKRWPATETVFRGDSHFASPHVMEWIGHQKHLFFVTGLTPNTVLRREAEITVQSAQKLSAERKEKVTLFHTLYYKAGTWHSSTREMVTVTERKIDGKITLRIRVAEPDIGKIIGRKGRSAQAMRVLLSVIAAINAKCAILEVDD